MKMVIKLVIAICIVSSIINCSDPLTDIADYQDGYHDTGLFEFALFVNGQYVDCEVIMSHGRDPIDGKVDHNDVNCTLPVLTDYNLVAKFTVSKYARAVVNDTRQVSEETVNDFSQEVVYEIHSKKNGYVDYYTVWIGQ